MKKMYNTYKDKKTIYRYKVIHNIIRKVDTRKKYITRIQVLKSRATKFTCHTIAIQFCCILSIL